MSTAPDKTLLGDSLPVSICWLSGFDETPGYGMLCEETYWPDVLIVTPGKTKPHDAAQRLALKVVPQTIETVEQMLAYDAGLRIMEWLRRRETMQAKTLRNKPQARKIHEALLIAAGSTKDADGKMLAERIDADFAGRMADVLVESFARMGLKVVEA